MADLTSFNAATTVIPTSSHTYSVAQFPREWCIGTVPHGGYITACFMRVATAHFSTTLKKQNQPHTITLHLEFLRRTEVGPATFTVKDVKLGRQTSAIHVTLSQEVDGRKREEVVGYITNSNLETESGPSFPTDWTLHPSALPAQPSKFLKDEDPNWREATNIPFPEFRKASTRVRFFLPRTGQRTKGLVDEWLTFTNGERFTNESLGFVCDMFLQLVEVHLDPDREHGSSSEAAKREKAKYWYPTVLLNLDVKKALPTEGVEWLFVRVQAKKMENGRYDLEVIIMDEAGDLVALSHHVCLVLDAARNLAKRSSGNETKL